jgi:aspartyl aminopeptidase
MEQRVLSDIVKRLEGAKYDLALSINNDFSSMLSGIVQAIEHPNFDQKKGKFVEILRETIVKMKKQNDELKSLALASSASSESSSPQDPR